MTRSLTFRFSSTTTRSQTPKVLERWRVPSTQAVEWAPRSSGKVSLATQELKRVGTRDLGREVTGQVLRNMYKTFQHREGLTRTFHVNITGPLVRLWLCDAGSVSTGRSFDVLQATDALPIAQIIAFLCSTAEQLVPTWKTSKGMILRCQNPWCSRQDGYQSTSPLTSTICSVSHTLLMLRMQTSR